MTAPLADLPRVDTVRPPHDRFFRTFRPSGRAALRTLWRVRNHGTHHLPERGPVILASNHVGLMDGPLLAIFCPRPVHALTKREMFDGRTGHGLRAVGQIPLARTEVDPAAVKTCLRVLDRGKVVGIYPEGARGAGDFTHLHAGVAYLALASGAPVVPVVNFGTRPPGGGRNALPRRGGRIDFVYGAPVRVPRRPWPRTREQVRDTALFLHRELLAHLDRARAETGLDLPGPIADPTPQDVLVTRPVSTKENLR